MNSSSSHVAVRPRLIARAFGALTAFVVSIAATETIAAQPIPRFAFESALAVANGRGGEFHDNGLIGTRLALSVRQSVRARTAVFGETGMDILGIQRGHDAVGIPSSRGGFKSTYPEFKGVMGMIGVLVAPRPNIEARLAIGGGAYRSYDGPHVGAAMVHADLAGFLLGHIGAVIGTRVVVFPSYRHDQLTIPQLTLGVRVR